MPIEYTVSRNQHYARLTCTGMYSLGDVLDVVEKGIDYAAAEQLGAALIDMTAVAGGPDIVGRFELGKSLAELQLGKPKLVAIAFVGTAPLIDPSRFGETVALNRCAVGKAFEDVDEAISWLEQTSG